MPGRKMVSLQVAGRRIENFLGYSIDADMYVADHAFRLDLANPEAEVTKGMQCELRVNGTLELTGIIDRVSKGYDKSGRRLTVEGRDLMGLLVDSYCEEFITVQGMDLKELAERLLKNVPFINRKAISFQENIVGNLKKKKGSGGSAASLLGEEPLEFAQIEPGQTIFEVLKEYSRSRGQMFWGMPDGSLVFGRPLAGGAASYNLITRRKDGRQNNILSGEEVDDISRRYSKIIVVGQQQGLDAHGAEAAGAEGINTGGEPIIDPDFPFYKPMVVTDNNDSRSPELHGRMLLEQQRQEGYTLSYKVPGHEQGGKNWAINSICHVEDEVFGVKGDFLVYGRTFELAKEGSFTSVRLGPPGILQ